MEENNVNGEKGTLLQSSFLEVRDCGQSPFSRIQGGLWLWETFALSPFGESGRSLVLVTTELEEAFAVSQCTLGYSRCADAVVDTRESYSLKEVSGSLKFS